MKIIAIIPIKGRIDIIRKTIPRLIKQVDKVIIAAHSEEEALICNGAEIYMCANDMKLGAKWQFCAERARDHNPDAILIMGSGCMITDNWIPVLYPYLEHCDMIGSGSIYFLDHQVNSKRMFHWPGYKGGRSAEPCGPGRLISARFLNTINWRIFDTGINSALDFSTMRIMRNNEGQAFVYKEDDIKVMRISSYKYTQKNSFDRLKRTSESGNISNIDEFLTNNFPDAL